MVFGLTIGTERAAALEVRFLGRYTFDTLSYLSILTAGNPT